MNVVALAAIAPQLWRNGAGSTRLLAQGLLAPTGHAAGTSPGGPEADWRISVAELAGSAPFSVFAGYDRCAVLIGGPALALHGETQEAASAVVFPARGATAHFAGETRLAVRDAPPGTRLFNVMTRRDVAMADVRVERAPTLVVAAGSVRLVYAIEGSYRASADLSADLLLTPDTALIDTANAGPLTLHRAGTGGLLVVVTVGASR